MGFKDFLDKIKGVFIETHPSTEFSPQYKHQEIIDQQENLEDDTSPRIIVKNNTKPTKEQSIEMLQKGFEKLITQLEGINQNLNSQVTQQQKLMEKFELIPDLVNKLPEMIKNNNLTVEKIAQQLKDNGANDLQMLELMKKLPEHNLKQTNVLTDINNRLSASAQTNKNMSESMNNFNSALGKLDQTTENQNDSIIQMSKTFATSDRYLKYLMIKQSKRFFWLFTIVVTISVFVILVFTAIIVWLAKKGF